MRGGIENVLELFRQFHAALLALPFGNTAQVEILGRPGEVAVVACFEKTADGGARAFAAQRIGLRGLGSQRKREEECGP